MKKLILGLIGAVLIASLFSFASFTVAAQDSADDSLGLSANETRLPSGLGRAIERLDLLLTLDKAAKAEKGLEHAERRLLEVRTLIQQNRLDQVDKAKSRYEETLRRVNSTLGEISDDDPEVELDKRLKIEKKLAEHEDRLERFETELEIKIKGNLTAEQRAALDALIESFKNETGNVRLKLEFEDAKVKVRLKEKLNKTDDEMDDLIKEKEDEINLSRGYERASEAAISKASEVISLVESRLNESEGTNVSEDLLHKANELLNESKNLLEEAKSARANGEHQKAIELANKAKSNILRFVHAQLVFSEEDEDEESDKISEDIRELQDKIEERRDELREKERESLDENKTEESDGSEDISDDSEDDSSSGSENNSGSN